jgi:hypothetical protein
VTLLDVTRAPVELGPDTTAPGGNETGRFLDALFGNMPDGVHLNVWTRQDRRSAWFQDTVQAEAYVAACVDRDVYVAVGLSARDLGPHHRSGNADVAGIVGFAADLDVAGPGHAGNKVYAPSFEEVLNLLNELPLAPTLVVHSGHGVQAWWLFEEPYVFDSGAERNHVAGIARGWQDTIRVFAGQRGWDVDTVSDLARLMRVPGTTNYKRVPVPVRLLQENGPWYGGPDDFEPYLMESAETAQVPVAPRQPSVLPELRLDRYAEPPGRRLARLLERRENFRKTWETCTGKRSPSECDLGLANSMVAAGWDNQEIVDALIAHRRERGHKLKWSEDYYMRTIERARADVLGDKDMLAAKPIRELVTATLPGLDTLPSVPVPRPSWQPEWAESGTSFRELLARDPGPVPWVVDGLLVEGLNVLAGKPKLGKSILVQQLSIAIASGQPFLGRDVSPGSVVHFALEDPGWRLSQRARAMRAPTELPITIFHKLTPLDKGGVEELERWLEEAEVKPRLLIIDTLTPARSQDADETEAGAMGAILYPLQRLGLKHHTAVLLVVHHNKMQGKRPSGTLSDAIRGSIGIGGAADALLGLFKYGQRRRLFTEARDGADGEIVLRLQDDPFRWVPEVPGGVRAENKVSLAPVEEAPVEDAVDDKVRSVLRTREGRATVWDVAKDTGLGRETARRSLERLCAAGQVSQLPGRKPRERQVYALASPVESRAEEPLAA